MAGLAERYWKELRPSSAGARFQLEVTVRYDQKSERSLRRPRPRPRPRLRTASR
jgi:hypothetical protein